MKKAIGQTVRDLRRGVNKKVLKVPSVEQKVLDATSNEPWGPHGSSLADIAQATRNYREYQIIMSIIWKRINDTGKNWRHVYKALTVLEYLVANGSERVIDEIKEHAYHISTLSGFQYIDSSGRDQGSNVRKKSQSLVALVNNKERIQEVREKAAANREKYRNTSMGGMYKPGSYPSTGGYGERYDDERYGGRDEDRNDYGREGDWGSRDNDRYGKYGDSNSRDGDPYARDYEGRYGRDGYRDDDSRGRSPSMDDYNSSHRSKSSDRYRDRSYDDDGQYSSRGSVGKTDGSQDGRSHDKKYSEQEPAAPPSYEEAVGDVGSPSHSERYEETSTASAPKSSSPPPDTTHQETTPTNPPAAMSPVSVPPAVHPSDSVHATGEKELGDFDEFDPRDSFTAATPSSNGAEVDFFGFSSDPYNLSSLTIVPTATATTTATSEADTFTNSGSGNGFFSETTSSNQPFGDPFGDGSFKAIPSTENFPDQQQNISQSFQPSSSQSELQQPAFQDNNFGFGEIDILADILPPPSGISAQTVQSASQSGFVSQTKEPETGFQGQITHPAFMTSFPTQVTHPSSMREYQEQAGQPSQQAGFPHQSGQYSSFTGFPGQTSQPGPSYNVNFNQQPEFAASTVESMAAQSPSGPPEPAPQMQQAESSSVMTSASSDLANYLAAIPPPAKDKFETKSTIWKDTLNRGLVNLNISGSKTNPLSDIGVDFDAINRKEKRMEKPSQTPVMSTVTMGKAMGSGTGLGRAGASVLRGGPNPITASGMNIGMGGVSGAGMGMGSSRGAGIGMGMVGVSGVGVDMGGGPGAGKGMGMPMGGGYGVNQPVGGGYGVNQPVGGGYGVNQPVGGGYGMNQPVGGGYGVNQPMGGMGMGMGMGMGTGTGTGTGTGMGMGMNMGMGRGVPMQQQPTGFSQVPGGYHPMMGMGNFGQQPYNGGHC